MCAHAWDVSLCVYKIIAWILNPGCKTLKGFKTRRTSKTKFEMASDRQCVACVQASEGNEKVRVCVCRCALGAETLV